MHAPAVKDKVDTIAQARLYKVIVLRDPAVRILSDFFYTMSGAWVPEHFEQWGAMFPEAYKAVQEGDFKKFIQSPNDSMNDMVLQLVPHLNKTVADGQVLNEALNELRRCKVVLLQPYLPQGLMMIEGIFGIKPQNIDTRFMHVRKSDPDPKREAMEKDQELMAMARQGAWADTILYQEAERIFFTLFTQFLNNRGEIVTDIHESLAKYAVAPEGTKPIANAPLKKNGENKAEHKHADLR